MEKRSSARATAAGHWPAAPAFKPQWSTLRRPSDADDSLINEMLAATDGAMEVKQTGPLGAKMLNLPKVLSIFVKEHLRLSMSNFADDPFQPARLCLGEHRSTAQHRDAATLLAQLNTPAVELRLMHPMRATQLPLSEHRDALLDKHGRG